ncbi:MAG: tetratricopeptide repeat protein [Chloroflexota bacterium]
MKQIWTWLGGFTVVVVLGIVTFFTFQNYLELRTIEAINVQFDAYSALDGDTIAGLIDARADAEQAVELAFNLLGLFEAMSLVITVGGVVLTAFGLTRFTTARNELEEARKLVERELEEARDRFEGAIVEREQELSEMRADLTAAAQNDRQRTSDALLANALIPLGERQYKTSDYKGALTTYNRALDLDPTNPVTNQRLGYVYVQLGQLDDARHHYETAIEREENFAPALAGLGFVNRRLGEQVAKDMQDGMSDEDRMAIILERDRLFNLSENLLLQALKLSPKLVDDDGESYWGILGGLYKRRGQIDQAIEAYRQVTEVTPQSSYGYNNMAQLYQKKNDREKALELYEIVERIASKEAEAEAGNFWGYSDLISASYAVGKVEQAKKALPIAISIAPVDSPYMLEGTRDTLRDLANFLEPEKVPPIEEAIEILEAEMAERKARVVT